MTRRIVLGEAAADDETLTEELATLMEQANGMPGRRRDPYDAFAARMAAYVAAAEPGSLAALAAEQDADPDTRVDGQLTHWLFATADTLAANVIRALALLTTHEGAGAQDALLEAMRLWPTTPMLARETTRTLVWDGVRVDAGTQVLVVNVFHHRDRERLGDRADRFSPEGWHDGTFADDWGLNHLSHGPQGCPGANLAILLGAATLEALLAAGPRRERPSLDPAAPLPHMLNPFGLRFALAAA
jgi:cytochrome P450